MFKWLKEKATQAAAKQCKLNISLNAKTLVSVSNRADAAITASGGKSNNSDIQQVIKAQENLLKDIILGCSNGVSLEIIKSEIINPIISGGEVSDGAKLAINHVLDSAKDVIEESS